MAVVQVRSSATGIGELIAFIAQSKQQNSLFMALISVGLSDRVQNTLHWAVRHRPFIRDFMVRT